jgi:hypothetical protein
MTETINGLHSCKPGNDPVVGQVKLFVIEHRKGKSGKPYIKIRSANADNGGTPHRILNAEKTDFVDQHGNVSYNLEIEQSSSPSTVQNLRATMQQGEGTPPPFKPDSEDRSEWRENAPQSPPHAQQGEDGVTEARKHLMRCCNLYNLCIAAADKAIAPNMPEIARTSEQFQSTLASLWIEASSRRCTNGVDWWSYIDKMPDTPVNGGKHSATVKPIQKEEEKNEPPF